MHEFCMRVAMGQKPSFYLVRESHKIIVQG
jgi:hypothetical protein